MGARALVESFNVRLEGGGRQQHLVTTRQEALLALLGQLRRQQIEDAAPDALDARGSERALVMHYRLGNPPERVRDARLALLTQARPQGGGEVRVLLITTTPKAASAAKAALSSNGLRLCK